MGSRATENLALLILARRSKTLQPQQQEVGGEGCYKLLPHKKRAVLNLSTPNCLLRGSITSIGALLKSDGLALSDKGFTPKHQLQKHLSNSTRKTAPFLLSYLFASPAVVCSARDDICVDCIISLLPHKFHVWEKKTLENNTATKTP